MKFHEKLYTLRKNAAMTQNDLAEKLNVSRQAVSRWEMGTAMPEIDNLIAMSDVFGVAYDNFTVPDGVPGVEAWMELLRPDGKTTVLRGYDHRAYSAYASVTLNRFGSGAAAYIGAMLSEEELDGLLEKILSEMDIPVSEYRWPLVIKEGVNDHDRTVRYLLNYSDDEQEYDIRKRCIELLTESNMEAGERLAVPAWGVAILEE